jgi:hypothetical protein
MVEAFPMKQNQRKFNTSMGIEWALEWRLVEARHDFGYGEPALDIFFVFSFLLEKCASMDLEFW